MTTEVATDELVKPDMQAVLSRTHLATTLQDFLLPVFEAVSNAMHGIEMAYPDDAAKHGKIAIRFEKPNDPAHLRVTVTDNGVGLTEENYKSFKTPYSGFKLKVHGRGFGRFIAFKVFAYANYWSRYSFFAEQKVRSFRFDVAQDREFSFLEDAPAFSHSGVQVDYSQPLSIWHDLIRDLKVEDVADAIGSHFLPYFLYGWLPDITIQFDDATPESIKAHFSSRFVQSNSGDIQVEIDGKAETLHYSIAKIQKTKSFKNHCLLLSAGDRIVGAARDLTNKLGQPHFVDGEDKRYIVLAVVRSEAFESRLNDARTGLNLSAKTVETIVSTVSDVIQQTETHQIERIKTEQSTHLSEALRENPILRIGLKGRSVTEYVASSQTIGPPKSLSRTWPSSGFARA